MPQGRNALIECRIYARATYMFDVRFRIERYGYGIVQLFLCLRNELVPTLACALVPA